MLEVKTGISRKQQLAALEIGDSTVVVGTSTVQQVQAAVATALASMPNGTKSSNFSQRKALLVTEGEIPIPCSIVTRVS